MDNFAVLPISTSWSWQLFVHWLTVQYPLYPVGLHCFLSFLSQWSNKARKQINYRTGTAQTNQCLALPIKHNLGCCLSTYWWEKILSKMVLTQKILKSDNLQYDMLSRWVDGTNDSSTKRLMFQALFFS